MRWQPTIRFLAFSGVGILVALIPVVADPYVLYLASVTAIYLIIALSLSLLLGYTGQISLGHAGFAAVGAYASAILTKQLGLGFGLAALFGAGLAAVVGLLVDQIALLDPAFHAVGGAHPGETLLALQHLHPVAILYRAHAVVDGGYLIAQRGLHGRDIIHFEHAPPFAIATGACQQR